MPRLVQWRISAGSAVCQPVWVLRAWLHIAEFLVRWQVSLMDEAGNTKDDLKLPTGTDDAEKLAVQLQEEFESGKELMVTVLKVRERAFSACVSGCLPLQPVCWRRLWRNFRLHTSVLLLSERYFNIWAVAPA